jgi:predicted ester cyclase
MPAQPGAEVLDVVGYERTWVESLNRGDISGADEAFAPDCVIHITGSPVADLDLAGFKQMVGGLLAAFPDLHFTIEDQIIAGDKVALRWVAVGTNTGPVGAAPPTGKSIRVEGLILDRVADGRVAERWEQWDQPAMLRQLGFA